MLTKRKKELLNFIINHVKQHDYAPSFEEIATEFGLSSVATVHEHVEALKEQGYLAQSRFGAARSLLPTNKAVGMARALLLPLAGLITAGAPIEAVEEGQESVAVPADFVVDGANSYVLKVKGESMIDEGIFDGDFVVVERNPSPRNGDVVVALLDNAYATLKKFYRERDRIRLQPANATMQPIFCHDPIIQGVVRAVIRRFSMV